MNYPKPIKIQTLEQFLALKPCKESIEYVKSKASLREAWDDCSNVSWMLWLVAHTDRVSLNKILSIIVKRSASASAANYANYASFTSSTATMLVAERAAYAAAAAAANSAAEREQQVKDIKENYSPF